MHWRRLQAGGRPSERVCCDSFGRRADTFCARALSLSPNAIVARPKFAFSPPASARNSATQLAGRTTLCFAICLRAPQAAPNAYLWQLGRALGPKVWPLGLGNNLHGAGPRAEPLRAGRAAGRAPLWAPMSRKLITIIARGLSLLFCACARARASQSVAASARRLARSAFLSDDRNAMIARVALPPELISIDSPRAPTINLAAAAAAEQLSGPASPLCRPNSRARRPRRHCASLFHAKLFAGRQIKLAGRPEEINQVAGRAPKRPVGGWTRRESATAHWPTGRTDSRDQVVVARAELGPVCRPAGERKNLLASGGLSR